MENIKELLEQKYKELWGHEPFSIRIAPHGFSMKNEKAIICQGKYTEDDFIAIWDASITGNGKSGVILTTDAICVKCASNYTGKFIARYEDIAFTTYTKEAGEAVLKLHMRFGAVYWISYPSISRKTLKEFIDYAMGMYQDDGKLEW